MCGHLGGVAQRPEKKTSGDGCDGTWQVCHSVFNIDTDGCAGRHSVFKLLETGVMARGRCVTASLTSILTDVLAGTASLKKNFCGTDGWVDTGGVSNSKHL